MNIKNKSIVILFTLILLCIISIGCVSATENTNTSNVNSIQSTNNSQDNINLKTTNNLEEINNEIKTTNYNQINTNNANNNSNEILNKTLLTNSENTLLSNSYNIYISPTGTGTGSNENNPSNWNTAYNSVEDGGTIIFTSGTYNIINQNITKDLTLQADTDANVILDAQNKGYIFALYNKKNLTLNSLTLTRGSGHNDYFLDTITNNEGGAIYISRGNLKNINLTYVNNSANEGGAIAIRYEGNITNINTTFINNYPQISGVIWADTFANVNSINTSFINNKGAINIGGGGNITCVNITFNNNTDEIIRVFNGNVTCTDSILSNNNGRSIELWNGTLILNNTSYINNTANNTAHIIVYVGDVQFTNSVFINNSEIGSDISGGIFSLGEGNFNCNYCTFINNTSKVNTVLSIGSECTYDFNSNWWGNNTPFINGNKLIYQSLDYGGEYLTPDNWIIMNLTAPNSVNTGENIDVCVKFQTISKNNTITDLTKELPTRNLILSCTGGSLNPTNIPITNSINSVYTAGNIPGNYNINVLIDQQILSTPLTITKSETKTNTSITTSYNNLNKILTLNLNANNQGLYDKTIFLNITQGKISVYNTLITNINGLSYINLSEYGIGTYNITCIFDGDINYNPCTESVIVNIKNNTNNPGIYGENLTMIYGTQQNYTGKLIGNNGEPLIGQHVAIKLSNSQGQSKIYYATTDNNGEYQLEINLYPGTYTAVASYDKYSCTNNIKVLKEVSNLTSTTLTANTYQEPYGIEGNFTGKLTDKNGKALIGQHIALKLSNSQGQSKIYYSTTDVNGEYQLAINLYPGQYYAECTYAGTSVYDSSTNSASITVTN